MKRLWMLGIVGLLVVSCAKKRQPVEMWPAYINDFQNFSEDQKAQFTAFVDALNSMAGKTLVSISPLEEGYPITVRITPSPSGKPNQAGFAVRSEENCQIDISTQVFEPYKIEYQKSVFLHELGHCAGLPHVSTQGAMMFPIAMPYPNYQESALQDFVRMFISSVN